jgi:hypothetical protein
LVELPGNLCQALSVLSVLIGKSLLIQRVALQPIFHFPINNGKFWAYFPTKKTTKGYKFDRSSFPYSTTESIGGWAPKKAEAAEV